MPEELSERASRFVTKILQREERIGVDELLEEAFLEEADTSYLF